MKHIHTFENFLNEASDYPKAPKPMKGLKYEKVKAKDLKVGDEISDGPEETWEIAEVVSINPFKLKVVETIMPKNYPGYKAPGTMIDHELRPNDEVYKILR